MSKQVINVGAAANDGTGTPTRTAFQYVNANFVELYNFITGTANGMTLPAALPMAKGGTGATTVSTARDNLGLGSAATKNTGKGSGDVAIYGTCFGGAYGSTVDNYYGSNVPAPYNDANTFPIGERSLITGSLVANSPTISSLCYFETKSTYTNAVGRAQTAFAYNTNPTIYKRFAGTDNIYGSWRYDLTSANTSVDGNGFIKKASPIVQLFENKIELNNEAQQQNIEFEKVAIGEYLIKGSTGFAQESWYVEMPKDANGNVLVAVVYKQLENKDISVKTYKKKFDIETASIIADLTQPIDIPEGRWIDLRLQELPQEVIDES